ncbi:hypothetical protein G6L37_00600 [Agrobacterium rubi]|nr:hypothetical protein [Agrobacterium rubi]NTF23889.1 hypothetical protein [Agrobacterium rubi]
MSGSMFIAVRTNDCNMLYANGYTRSAYNVFSYREIFNGDDAPAIRFITEWNEGDIMPSHVRPLEYGALVVDFPTRQILLDSYYDTNIDIVTCLRGGGSFTDELKALGRTRTASDEELRRPVYDLHGNLWDGIGEMPDEGGSERGKMSYDDGFYIDYSPWTVRCFPETPGGRIAFLNAVESCGFPVRRDLWENRSSETEQDEKSRVSASADIRRVMSRLSRRGVLGEPLWSLDADTGAFTANVILRFKRENGQFEHVLAPVTISGDAELTPISKTVGTWHPDETIYTNGFQTFSDLDGEDDYEMIPFSEGVCIEDRLDLFACLLLGAGDGGNRVLREVVGGREDGAYRENIPVSGMAEVDIEYGVTDVESAETPQEEIERVRVEAERRLRRKWAVHQGCLLGSARESFWGVLSRGGVIEIGPEIYSNSLSGNIYGQFGVERRDEAFAYAYRLLEIGAGSEIVAKGDNLIITPGSSRAFVNHGAEIKTMGDSLVTRAHWSIRDRDGLVDVSLKEKFKEISEVLKRHRTEWRYLDRPWPLDDEWRNVWGPLSAALGAASEDSLSVDAGTKRPSRESAAFWRLKAAIDMVSFPEVLKA